MVVGREALATIPPRVILSSRLLGGFLLFSCLARFEPSVAPTTSNKLRLVWCSLFGAVLNQVFFVYGLQRTTATHASVLSASIPVLTLLLAIITRSETLSARKLTGIALGLAGALSLIAFSRGPSDGHSTLLGDLMIAANCACWAAFLILVKVLAGTMGPMQLAARLFLCGCVALLPFCISPWVTYAPRATMEEVGYLSFIVLIPTVGAYAFNQIAVRHHPASLVAIHWYLLPVFGVLGAAVRLGEALDLRVLVFALLICGGILLSVSANARLPASVNGKSARGWF